MPFLDEAIRQAQSAIEHKFLFRKLGLPYDYASPPDEFPSKAFATAKEARGNLPNPAGLGAGYHCSCRNHALLFDAYLLRIELGIESGADEQILDRLIGGLIRIATVAPKSFLISGLAADGRGFYAWTSWQNHAAWAFAAGRGLTTAAISPESQEKFRSIVGKWLDRVKRDEFAVKSIDGKVMDHGDLAAVNGEIGPVFLAMLLVGCLASGDIAEQEAYEIKAEEESRARLGKTGASVDDIDALLWRQAALSIISKHDFNPERAELAKERMRENAGLAAKLVGGWRDWDQSLVDADINLDWRRFAKKNPAESSGLGFDPGTEWDRLKNEEPLARGLAAMLIIFWAEEKASAEAISGEVEECLQATPWDKLMTLQAVSPAVVLHVRGAEMELWDKELFATRHNFQFAEESLAARYLEPDYDEVHPEQAGHSAPPPGKKGHVPKGDGKRRKRRRRR